MPALDRRDQLVAPRFQSPPPTGYDPRGYAVGVLANRAIERRGLRLTQWRWRYGREHRDSPFQPHRELAGRFMKLDGTLNGWYPGDHKGCLCAVAPVYRAATR